MSLCEFYFVNVHIMYLLDAVNKEHCRNWSREVGDCDNTSARPSQQPKPSKQGKVLAADSEGTGITTITYLSLSITIIPQHLQTCFAQVFALN